MPTLVQENEGHCSSSRLTSCQIKTSIVLDLIPRDGQVRIEAASGASCLVQEGRANADSPGVATAVPNNVIVGDAEIIGVSVERYPTALHGADLGTGLFRRGLRNGVFLEAAGDVTSIDATCSGENKQRWAAKSENA